MSCRMGIGLLAFNSTVPSRLNPTPSALFLVAEELLKEKDMNKNQGISAYINAGDDYVTLRDYFAAKALAGMLADPQVTGKPELVAKAAYQYADAMLAERVK